MLVDANLLLYAVDADSPWHEPAAAWLTEQLNGTRRVGLPWQSLLAFLRISTHPRATSRPLGPVEAWQFVEEWLAAPTVWVPGPTERHAIVLGSLLTRHRISGNLLPDAHLAAMAIEHGLDVCSADTDFARFDGVRWVNPVAAARERTATPPRRD
jgi:toxin-antitoxin system PIN domain toxin